MVVGYAASAEHFTVRYIEKIALDWADKGILTIDAAERHLCYLERCQQALLKVQTVCKMPQPLSPCATHLSLAEKWIFGWHIGDELLQKAYETCVQKTGKFSPKYMDRVLENWHEQGIKTADDLKPLSAKGGKKSAEKGEYEQMVENYIPVYKKKKG
jgi:DnaD/phage-associated family protein